MIATTKKKSMQDRPAETCPHCNSNDFVKRGVRKNKYQDVQLYLCRSCEKTFTSRTIKGKQFPWPAVLDAISYHNLGYSFESIPKILKVKRGVSPTPETVAKWYEEYKYLCRFERMRPYALKLLRQWQVHAAKYNQKVDMVEVTTLAHRQLYRFRYHRPKLALLLEEYNNRNFTRLMNFLDAVSTETPHQFFNEQGERMSEIKSKFSTAEMIVTGKENFATRLTAFVLQSVPDNKQRHEEVQRFLIANDSVTVATEVPVYITLADVEHFESVLKFNVLDGGQIALKRRKRLQPFPQLLTGHIDAVQVRNGVVHILDYKPNAAKEKPIEQLTWYALSLSRLTGLRLFEFKCAWFDEHDYFEFYPLHVVKKQQRKRRKRVTYNDGTQVMVPKENELTIVHKKRI